jgi:arylamine N-acetyltransferase
LYYLKTKNLKGIPDLDDYLYGIENFRFGGTCYSNNHYLNLLLKDLGFEVKLCGADMNAPNVHIVNIVSFGDEEYLVDVGYAAPFTDPVPINESETQSVKLGGDEYLIYPKDKDGSFRLSMFRDKVEKHGYTVNPKPCLIDDFSEVISDSFRPGATFMNCLLMVNFKAQSSFALHNYLMTESRTDTVKRQSISSKSRLFGAIRTYFGTPVSVSKIALDDIVLDRDAWR